MQIRRDGCLRKYFDGNRQNYVCCIERQVLARPIAGKTLNSIFFFVWRSLHVVRMPLFKQGVVHAIRMHGDFNRVGLLFAYYNTGASLNATPDTFVLF